MLYHLFSTLSCIIGCRQDTFGQSQTFIKTLIICYSSSPIFGKYCAFNIFFFFLYTFLSRLVGFGHYRNFIPVGVIRAEFAAVCMCRWGPVFFSFLAFRSSLRIKKKTLQGQEADCNLSLLFYTSVRV